MVKNEFAIRNMKVSHRGTEKTDKKIEKDFSHAKAQRAQRKNDKKLRQKKLKKLKTTKLRAKIFKEYFGQIKIPHGTFSRDTKFQF